MKVSDRFKQFLRTQLTPLWVIVKGNKFLLAHGSYLNRVGYIESIRKGAPCKADGSPLPWMNYCIIAFMEERIPGDAFVFEYGSGSSTLFWSSRVSGVTAVEHDREWFETISSRVPANVLLIYRPAENPEDYVNSILETDKEFDVIVIDGIRRAQCLLVAPKRLSPIGVIILDDSDRRQWNDGVDFLLSLGFKQLKFRGLKPTGFAEDETSVFYRPGNCLGI